jgi:hypothetical protein
MVHVDTHAHLTVESMTPLLVYPIDDLLFWATMYSVTHMTLMEIEKTS